MKLSTGGPLSAIARRTFLRLAGIAALTQVTPARAEQPAPSPAPEIWPAAFADKSVWGYTDKHSVAPGEPFDLMLATGPARQTVRGRVEVFRVGHHPGGQRLVWTSPELTVEPGDVLRTAAAIGAAWSPVFSDIPTEGWATGYYSVDFIHTATGARELQVAHIVVRKGRKANRVLLKLSTNTYQAYNGWGGHSLYPDPPDDETKRGAIVSFDRPTEPAFFEYEVYLVRWLEELGAKHGFGIDYVTDFDVHRDPTLVNDYALVISGGHDEYWTKEMFDAFEHRIFKLGRNVIFFSANTAYCQVRFVDVDCPPDGTPRGRQIVCYKDAEDPIIRRKSATAPELLATTLFRERARRPETMLMGVGFQGWFSPTEDGPRYPYFVASTDAPFFAGLDYKVGDAVADVVGYEWDNRDPDGDGKHLWNRRNSRIAVLPQDSIKVLFQGAPVDTEGKTGRAEAVYFQSAAGAKVFSSGSIRWTWGLGKPSFERDAFKRFNANLILDFLK